MAHARPSSRVSTALPVDRHELALMVVQQGNIQRLCVKQTAGGIRSAFTAVSEPYIIKWHCQELFNAEPRPFANAH